jgi:microcystin-dependent protein
MSEPFLGQLILVPYNFAPRGWAFCNGQILSISQNTALFSLLGTTYGGNGQTTFALPDLRGRAPISSGQLSGGQNYSLGEVAGTEFVTLTQSQMPQHNHLVACFSSDFNSGTPKNNLPAGASAYTSAATDSNMKTTMIGLAGGSQPFDNRMPFLVLNWCIALQGIFPSRN